MTEPRRVGPILALALLFGALGLRLWVFEPVRIRSSSMAPTLLAGDVVLVSRLGQPVVGDVVLVRDLSDDGDRHVKRLVAGAGQVVELSGGQLYVDGQRVARADQPTLQAIAWTDADCGEHRAEYLLERGGDETWTVIPGGAHDRATVPADAAWLLGDNRGASSDSRHWGAVPLGLIDGTIRWVLWSRSPCGEPRLNRIGPLRLSPGVLGVQSSR